MLVYDCSPLSIHQSFVCNSDYFTNGWDDKLCATWFGKSRNKGAECFPHFKCIHIDFPGKDILHATLALNTCNSALDFDASYESLDQLLTSTLWGHVMCKHNLFWLGFTDILYHLLRSFILHLWTNSGCFWWYIYRVIVDRGQNILPFQQLERFPL